MCKGLVVVADSPYRLQDPNPASREAQYLNNLDKVTNPIHRADEAELAYHLTRLGRGENMGDAHSTNATTGIWVGL